ncbi:unnamed protein product [Prunus armeniaca]|uniref:Uncharacterized protein n=1 Tax=Prunus armeniaca TaxID=36596 RepID=A0A6J5VEI0_PRUAR|nr:unnamed protein product [Prunus armeniaca]
MARYYPRLFCSEIILARVAEILDVEHSNEAHQAGSNSLLIANVFSKMNTIAARMSQGCLYGITPTIVRAPLVVIHMPSSWASPQRYWQPLQAHVVVAPMILHR